MLLIKIFIIVYFFILLILFWFWSFSAVREADSMIVLHYLKIINNNFLDEYCTFCTILTYDCYSPMYR